MNNFFLIVVMLSVGVCMGDNAVVTYRSQGTPFKRAGMTSSFSRRDAVVIGGGVIVAQIPGVQALSANQTFTVLCAAGATGVAAALGALAFIVIRYDLFCCNERSAERNPREAFDV